MTGLLASLRPEIQNLNEKIKEQAIVSSCAFLEAEDGSLDLPDYCI
jgi:hypothetical protein